MKKKKLPCTLFLRDSVAFCDPYVLLYFKSIWKKSAWKNIVQKHAEPRKIKIISVNFYNWFSYSLQYFSSFISCSKNLLVVRMFLCCTLCVCNIYFQGSFSLCVFKFLFVFFSASSLIFRCNSYVFYNQAAVFYHFLSVTKMNIFNILTKILRVCSTFRRQNVQSIPKNTRCTYLKM